MKAVQEFGDLCDKKDKDIVKSVLPFWPRLFNKIALVSEFIDISQNFSY